MFRFEGANYNNLYYNNLFKINEDLIDEKCLLCL